MSSSGIRALIERYAEAVRQGDIDAIAELVDDSEDVLVIGTDPHEWWAGHDRLIGVYRAQQAEMGSKVTVSTLELETAREIGEAGWFAGRIHFETREVDLPVRVSGVARRRGDEWRIVHLHVSVGAANEETIGLELPTD